MGSAQAGLSGRRGDSPAARVLLAALVQALGTDMGTMRLPMKRLIAAEMVFKRRMRQSGNVDIPQRALLAVLGGDEEEA